MKSLLKLGLFIVLIQLVAFVGTEGVPFNKTVFEGDSYYESLYCAKLERVAKISKEWGDRFKEECGDGNH